MGRLVKILLLTANPRGTTKLRLDEEAREIDEGLRRSILRDRYELRAQWAVRPRDVTRALLDYAPDIVHFSGHGTAEEGLAFEGEDGGVALVSTNALASLFELLADHVRCVVLNACYSEIQARSIALHIEHVVGMQRAIGDRAAIAFAVGFYDALGAGRSVPTAYRFGCNAIRMMGMNEHETPILLMKEGVRVQKSHWSDSCHIPVTRSTGSDERRADEWTSGLSVMSIADVLEWGWDGIRLLEALIHLDYETTDELVHAHEGDSAQWGPVFMAHPETWRLLTTGPERIVGYWHMAPLFSKEYEMAKAGQLLDSQITVEKVRICELPGVYPAYFVQVCMLPQYRRPRMIQLLFDSIFNVIENLAQGGVFLSEITANAYTPLGEAICRSLDMQFLCRHREHGKMYFAPIGNVLQHTLVSRRPELRRRYMNHGLYTVN